MPKVKRFQNPLKSAHAPHDANRHSSSSTSPTLSHAIEPSTSVQSPPHDASNSSLADDVQQQEQTPTQPSNSSTRSKSEPHWTVETIDLTKTIKNIRVKVHDVNNLPLRERIIVNFNEYGSAIGAAQGLLAGYCGTLATDCNVFPISFDKWLGPAGVPENYKEDCFETFLKELCKRNKENRSKQKIPHTGGSKSLARRRHEIFLATGENSSRGRIFIETHKRKGGSYVNEEARIIGEQIELDMTQCNESEASPNDIIGKLFGAEHSGRVRCLGMGAAPSNTFKNTKQRLTNLSDSSSNPGASFSANTYLHQKVSCLEYQLEGTLNALKTYMISKEGSVPAEFAGLFAPQPQSSDTESEPTPPVDIRGSSGGSNGNHQENT